MSKPTDIELSVGLSVEDIGKSAKELQSMIKDIFDRSAGKNLDVSLQKVKERMASVTAESIKVIKQMQELENTAIPTKEFAAVEDHLRTVEAEYERLQKAQDNLREHGVTEGNTWDSLQADLEKFGLYIEEDERKLQELVNTGKAFTLGSDTQQYQKLADKLAGLNNKTRVLINSWDQHTKSVKKSTKETNKFTSGLKKTIASMFLFGRASRNAGGGLNNFASGIKQGIRSLLKYALGITTLAMLFNKLRAAIKEGIQNLVLWEGQNGKLNKSISSMLSAISTLKNNIGALAAPLINLLAPAITKIINLMSVAIQKINMFVAALTGQKTILVANEVQENYAASLDKTAKSAKKAEKALKGYLSPLDEINKYQSNVDADADSGGAGGAGGGTFKEIPIDSKIFDLINKLKSLLEKLQPVLDYLKKTWESFKEGFLNALGDWKRRIENILFNLRKIKQIWHDIWTDPAVTGSLDKFIQSIARFLGSLTGAIASIGLTLIQNLVGGIEKYLEQNQDRIKQHLIDMFDIWSDILDQLSEFLASVAYVFEAFGDENGQRLTAAIIGIFVDAFMGVKEFVSKIIRDIIHLITDPFIDNADEIKTAIDGALGFIATNLETIKQAIDDISDTINNAYDKYIQPVIENITTDVSDFVGQFLDWWNTDVQPILDEAGKDIKQGYEQYIKPVIEELDPLIEEIGTAIDNLWNNFLKPVIQWIIDNVLPALIPVFKFLKATILPTLKRTAGILGSVIDGLKSPFEILNGIFQGIMTGDWSKLWEGFADALSSLWGPIDESLSYILDLFDAWGLTDVIRENIIDPIVEYLSDLYVDIREFFVDVYNYVDEKIHDIEDTINSIVDWIDDNVITPVTDAWNAFSEFMSQLFEGIWIIIQAVWILAAGWFEENVINPIKEKWEGFKKKLEEIWTNVKSKVVEKWTEIKNWMEQNVIEPLKKKWEDFKLNIQNKFQAIVTKIKEIFKPVIEWFRNTVIDPLTSRFNTFKKDTVTTFNSLWDIIKEGAKAAFNGVIIFVEKAVNGIIRGVNKFLSIFDEAVSIASEITGDRWGGVTLLHEVSLPRLAQGAVIPPNKQFMAVLGDQKSGTNIETPLSTMVDAFNTALQQNGGAGQPITLNLMLPNKQMIAQYAIEGGQVLQMSRGRNPFLLERG